LKTQDSKMLDPKTTLPLAFALALSLPAAWALGDTTRLLKPGALQNLQNLLDHNRNLLAHNRKPLVDDASTEELSDPNAGTIAQAACFQGYWRRC
jgi:hypothetical protein